MIYGVIVGKDNKFCQRINQASNYSDPFDFSGLYPWCDIKEKREGIKTYYTIPDVWYKIYNGTGTTIYQISDKPSIGFTYVPSITMTVNNLDSSLSFTSNKKVSKIRKKYGLVLDILLMIQYEKPREELNK